MMKIYKQDPSSPFVLAGSLPYVATILTATHLNDSLADSEDMVVLSQHDYGQSEIAIDERVIAVGYLTLALAESANDRGPKHVARLRYMTMGADGSTLPCQASEG